MKQVFKVQFRSRNNLILLNYANNFHKFTFLETDYKRLYQEKYLPSKKLDIFLQKMKKHQKILVDLEQHDFTQQDLRKIQTSNQKQFRTQSSNKKSNYVTGLNWFRNHEIITELSYSYSEFLDHTYQNLNIKELDQLIKQVGTLNCMDIRLWQRLIPFIMTYYKASSLDTRLLMITALSEYLKKFQPMIGSTKRFAFKFMYPENYITDIIDFRSFFKAIQFEDDFIKQSDDKETYTKKLQLLESFVYLILKATKKADMNIYSVRNYFSRRTSEMIQICSRHKQSPLHQRLLYNIYFIYSYINYSGSQFYEHVEKYYFEYLRRNISLETGARSRNDENQVSNKNSKQINKVLSIWKLNQRPNAKVYQQIIRPFLKQTIDEGLQRKYYSNIGLNILMSGLNDIQLLNQIVSKSHQQGKVPQDQFLHMLKHYINIANKNSMIQKYDTSYTKCSYHQNQKIVEHLSAHRHTVFSSCLQKKSKSLQRQQKSTEYHRVEKIWSQVISQAFSSSQYQVIENARFCTYEIDFLVLEKDGNMLAIEIQGGHYNKKDYNRGQNIISEVKHTGKKQIKEAILRAYDIKTVRIHCEQKIPTYIMQSRSVQLGKNYIMQKVRQQTGFNIKS